VIDLKWYFLAVFPGCAQVFCIFQFLSRVADVLTDYLGDLNEDIIKDNFVIVYQVYFLASATVLPTI
jgi:hypothetical protein